MALKKFKNTDRIIVTNTLPYEISLRVFIQKQLSNYFDGSILIQGNETYRLLTYEEVAEQIICGNPLFVGTDTFGKNATLIIEDFEAHKALFNLPDLKERPLSLNQESILKVMDIQDRDEFEAALIELLPFNSHKRAFTYYILNQEAKKIVNIDIDFDNLPGWKIKTIEKVVGYKIFDKYDPRMERAIEMTEERAKILRMNGDTNTVYLN